jgi:type VI secretion system protein ImpL
VDNLSFSADQTVTNEISESNIIRNTFFGGENGALNFSITPGSITNAHKAVLSYDGKVILFDGDADAGVNMVWPPQNTDGSISIRFDRLLMSDEVKNFMGPWALFHLLQSASLVRSKYGSQYQVNYTDDGMSMSFSLSANSVNNPFDLKLLRNYRFPTHF